MPTISQFYGIKIRMFFNDHSPPHFHAAYGEYELTVLISPIKIQKGNAPARVKSMVIEWAGMHQQELIENWNRCCNENSPWPIEPLE